MQLKFFCSTLKLSLIICVVRRILHDDSRGVGEPLDEVVCVDNDCEGLTV
jgi:alpha-mannosidase